MAKIISKEIVEKIVKMYNTNNYTKKEIANLMNVSVPFISNCMKGRSDPNIVRWRGGGYWLKKKKYDEEKEQEIAEDYYKNGFSLNDLKGKYNIHPMQLQKIRDKYSCIYGQKKRGRHIKTFEKAGEETNGYSTNDSGAEIASNQKCYG